MSSTLPSDLHPTIAFELMDLSSEAVLAYRETDGSICFWSRGAQALYGWSREEALGQSVVGLLRTVVSETHGEVQGELRRTGAWQGKLLNWTRDGRRVVIASRWRVHHDEAGHLTTILRVDQPCTAAAATSGTPATASDDQPNLGALLDAIDDAVMGSTLDGRITSWNRAAERLYGYPAAEAIGSSIGRILAPDAGENLRSIVAGLESGEGLQILNSFGRDQNGRSSTRALRVSGIRADDGSLIGLAYTAHRSAEHQRAQSALQASERRVRRLVESNIIGITLGDLEGRIIEANDALLNMVGYSRGDLQAGRLRWDTMTPPDYLPQDALAIAQAHQVGAVQPWEKEYIRKDGTRVPVMVGLAMLDEHEGTTVAFIIDLTEQKRGEAERNRLVAENQRQQALLEAVFTATPTCLLVATGSELTVRYVNPSFTRLMPHSDDVRIGVPLPEAWPEIGQSELLSAVEEVVRTGVATTPSRYESTHADGTRASFEFHVIEMRWLDEPGALLALWDTTPLEEARKAAEAAVRIRDDFIAVASHELKSPTTALMALSQLARKRLKRGEVLQQKQITDLVDVMEWESHRLNMLTARLLDTSRIQAGTLALECEPTDLVSLIRNIIRAAGPAQPVNFTAPDTLVADIDPVRVEQVVRNLLDNAIKYGSANSSVDISLSMEEPEVATLAVRDHGPGIAPEHRAHIFEQFYRANRTAGVPGMGLGLHISYEIVMLHGGSITAEFPSDGGTRFVVRLPTVHHTTDASD